MIGVVGGAPRAISSASTCSRDRDRQNAGRLQRNGRTCRGRKSRPPRAFLVLFCAFSGACFFVAFLVPAGGIQSSLFSCFFVLLEACAFLLLLLFRPLRSSGGNYDSGSQSLKELVNPTLTVTVPAFKQATAADVTLEVQVFHKVLTLNSISSSDGRITQSISI